MPGLGTVGRPRPTPAVCSNLYPGLFDSLREGLGKSWDPAGDRCPHPPKTGGAPAPWWLKATLWRQLRSFPAFFRMMKNVPQQAPASTSRGTGSRIRHRIRAALDPATNWLFGGAPNTSCSASAAPAPTLSAGPLQIGIFNGKNEAIRWGRQLSRPRGIASTPLLGGGNEFFAGRLPFFPRARR